MSPVARRANGVHRRFVSVRARDEDQAVPDNRCRCRDVAAAGQLPELAAGFEVVAAGVLPAVDDDLRAAAGVDDRRRSPGRHIAARHAPESPCRWRRRMPRGTNSSARRPERSRTPLWMIGERGESPLSFRCLEESGVEDAEVLAPEPLAGEVVDMQPFRPEERCQVGAVSGQRGVRLCALRCAASRRGRPCAPSAPNAWRRSACPGR